MPVTDVLRLGVAVATPLSLLGLIAALSYYFYSRHLKSEEKKLEALPLEQRARLADQRLSRYGIDGANLTRDERLVSFSKKWTSATGLRDCVPSFLLWYL